MFRNFKIRPRDLHRGMGEGEVEPKVSGQVLALCHCVHGTLRLCVSVCCLPHAVALTEKAAKHRASISGLADSPLITPAPAPYIAYIQAYIYISLNNL